MKRPNLRRQLPALRLLAPLSLLLILLTGGCVPRREPATQPQAYFGPTITLQELVARINQNNQKIPTLWSRFSYDITLRNPDTGKSDSAVDDDGKLSYRAPGEFRLVANKTPVGRIMDMGINEERFWLVATPPNQEGSMWWGNTGQEQAPAKSDIPIQPEGLLQVLAVSTYNTDLTQEPAPVLRFNNDADCYMVTFVAQQQDHYAAVREVWYQRETLLPVLVLLFDADGRVVLRAKLTRHQAILNEGKPGATIATDYDIFLPDTKSHMRMTLRDFSYTHGDSPSDASFRFPGFDQVPQSKVKQVNADAQK